MTEASLRVLLVDDQALVRTGFRMILESDPDIEVVGEAPDGDAAITLTRQLRPDVVLMDIRMPVLDGLEATRRLLVSSPPDTDGDLPRIVVLTTFDLDEYVYAALQAGASGFLLKDVSADQLIAAVRTVQVGDALLSPTITRRLVERFTRPSTGVAGDPAALGRLTPREHEVLGHLARGMSNAEIAEALVVSETTVKSHVASLLGKLQLRNRAQAVVLAYEAGIVRAGDPPTR